MPNEPQQHPMNDPFDATPFIIAPPEPVHVERRDDGTYLLRWPDRMYVREIGVIAPGGQAMFAQPEVAIDQEAMTAVVALATPATRPLFAVTLADGRRLTAAERDLPLPSGVNFRDVGGYTTDDGRAVRWGCVYRAGSLAELSDADVAYLGRLGLRLACDLRSADEVARQPDRLPPGATHRHQEIVGEVGRLRRVVTLYRKRHRVQELLADVYRVMLDQNGAVFAGVLRLAADPANRPLVIHCTAGKDRTGLTVALLLRALGVPEETVVADYTLSNNAYGVLAGRLRPEMARLYALGFGEVQLRPFLLAEARTLQDALAYLSRRYGSVAGYLQRAGLDQDTLDRLREQLLEPRVNTPRLPGES